MLLLGSRLQSGQQSRPRPPCGVCWGRGSIASSSWLQPVDEHGRGGHPRPIKGTARDLGVRYVLEGSVRKFGSRLRIIAQLIDASTGTHLWADRFEGGLEDVFELQDRVATSVAGIIVSKLERAEIEPARRKPTKSLDAYDFYLRGLANLHQLSRRSTDEALGLFCKATEVDPTFASAYAMAAICRSRRLAYGYVADREGEEVEAERVARRAAHLGADDAMALTGAAFALLFARRDFEVCLALVERALVLNPNLAQAWFAGGSIRVHNGEPDSAIAHFEYAMRLSPFDPFITGMWRGIALAHLLAGRYDQSLSASEHGLPNHVADLTVLAASSALAGRMDKARAAMARIRKRNQRCVFRRSRLLPLFADSRISPVEQRACDWLDCRSDRRSCAYRKPRPRWRPTE
jgi:hypothetical protein